METKDNEFSKKLLATFRVEAEDHIKTLNNGLLALEKGLPPEKLSEQVDAVFREAHSLKGAARSVNLLEVQSICQAMENVLAALKNGSITLSKPLFDLLYKTTDFIYQIIFFPSNNPIEVKAALGPIMEQLDQFLSVKKETNASKEILMPPSTSQSPSAKEEKKEAPISHVDSILPDKTIRISVQKLSKLLQQIEELLILKLTSRSQIIQLNSLLTDLQKWNQKRKSFQKEFSSSMEGDKAMIKCHEFFDMHRNFIEEVKEQLSGLLKITKQDYRVMSGSIDLLLEGAKNVLMQPFSLLTEGFPRMVRDIAQDLNKEILFEVSGGNIEIDKRVMEELKDPLIHLIRNSIDHGIESSEERLKKNKNKMGTVRICASQIGGNNVELIIEDDGRGIDIQKVKESAIKNGIISSKESEALSEQAALLLIFQSGVSTSPIITELSGRGLGMGIVLEKVDLLGGQVFVENKVGAGTLFRIILPLTLATFRGIHIRASEKDFIIPTHNVKRILRIEEQQIKTVENRETISVDGQRLSFASLSEVLNLSPTPKNSQKKIFAMLVKAAERTIAFGVDEILTEQEVLVKNLGKHLVRLKNILAATVTEWGKVIPILNPQDLIKSALKAKSSKVQASLSNQTNKKKTILLAEDSITTRMLIKNILEASGYEVKVAVDGLEALSLLKTEEAIDLLLSDVEMPRMDGLKLTQELRHLEKFKELPIVLCTARGSREDREKGIAVGANAYLDKANFTQNHLLAILQRLL